MKLFRFVLTVLLGVMLILTACGSPAPAETTAAPDTTAAPETTAAPVTTTDGLTTAPETTAAPVATAVPKTLKILAIGNSFSVDGMEYLYQIAKDAGVEEIVLGNLYKGGCSLAQHYGYAKADSEAYTYYKNTTGTWVTTSIKRMSQALADEEWDYISLQQASGDSGVVSAYTTFLPRLIEYVRERNTSAELMWHMTWAYQQDSTHSSFPKYGSNQTKMYEAILGAVNTCIVPNEAFSLIIPSGTAIQNARTSFLGDTITRDGYHLDYNIGRYIAGLTWYAAITGAPVDNIKYNPSVTKISEDMLAVAREAAANAVASPFAVTASKITTGERPDAPAAIDPSVVLNPVDFYDADTKLAALKNVDLSKYTLLEWAYLDNSHWNSTSDPNVRKSSGSTNKQFICTAEKYSLDQLPLGTVFICDPGWQYRLEKYENTTAKYSGSRPGNKTDELFVLDQAFLGSCKYVTWNVSTINRDDISAIYAQAVCHVRVYLPKP